MEWLYSGASALINKDDYLLGKPVDKNFELLQSGSLDLEAASGSGVAPSLDHATKIREDPLCAIRKRQEEQRKQWLNNPVKMKQIQKMLEEKQREKKEKKKKVKKHKRKGKHKKTDDIADRSVKGKKRKKASDSDGTDSTFMGMDVKKLKQYLLQDGLGDNSSSSSDEGQATASESFPKRAKQSRASIKEVNSHKRSYDVHERNFDKTKRNGHNRDDKRESERSVRKISKHSPSPPARTAESKSHYTGFQKPVRKKLSADEMEKRREEMEANAKWRDETRKQSVDKYNRDEAKELEAQFKRKADFITPMVSQATSKSSVEDRIKRNIYKVRQSGKSLDSNFAKK